MRFQFPVGLPEKVALLLNYSAPCVSRVTHLPAIFRQWIPLHAVVTEPSDIQFGVIVNRYQAPKMYKLINTFDALLLMQIGRVR